jgi:CheY-like chemotaxis protein
MGNQKKKNRVLIVEDDRFQALLIKKLITKLGYTSIGEVVTGEKAVEIALELNPDVILMDISLDGEMDGVTAVMQIREKKDIPVIYITGNSDSYNYDRAEQTDFVDYLIKPISSKMLIGPLKKATSQVEELE